MLICRVIIGSQLITNQTKQKHNKMKKLSFLAVLLVFLAAGKVDAQCVSGNCTSNYGVYRYNNGKYMGNFRNSLKEGFGVYLWDIGDTYSGNWYNDRMSGMGTYTFSNGDRYIGDFVNGKKQGQGMYYYANGTYAYGTWDNDKLLSNSTSTSATSTKDDAFCTTFNSVRKEMGSRFNNIKGARKEDSYGVFWPPTITFSDASYSEISNPAGLGMSCHYTFTSNASYSTAESVYNSLVRKLKGCNTYNWPTTETLPNETSTILVKSFQVFPNGDQYSIYDYIYVYWSKQENGQYKVMLYFIAPN
jgi:hypothetical protein